MKRIISFAVSVLMVMTVFCGVLTVGSSAADAAGKITFTSVAGPINEDGTFELKVYANDLTDYGFFGLTTIIDFDRDVFEFDTKSEIVGRDTYTYVSDASSLYIASCLMSGTEPFLLNLEKLDDKKFVVLNNNTEADYSVSILNTKSKTHYPIKLNKDFIEQSEKAGYLYTKKFPSFSTSDIGYFSDGSVLYATYYLKVKDTTKTGNYSIKVTPDYGGTVVALTDSKYSSTGEGSNWRRFDVDNDAVVVPATITLGSSTDITTSVADSASIRLNADKNPARCGLRFVGTINVPEAKRSDVVDFGIAITDENNLNAENKSDVTIGTDGKQVVLKIPAKVNINGESLRKTDGNIDWTKAANATFSGVISNIKTTNYNRTFTAKVYYQLSNGTVVYSTGTIDRSVKQVYSSMVDDPTANQDAVAWVKGYFKGHMN